MKFKDQVVVVTGASSGIGEAVTKYFLEQGAKVVGCGIEPTMKIDHHQAFYFQADLTNPQQATNVIDQTIDKHGKINKLICCAGITKVGSMADTSYQQFMQEMEINLGGVFNICRAAMGHLVMQEHSAVVTVGSDLGVRPIKERIGYCPSKAAVIMLTKCMALEYAPRVRVNAILPGLVRTPMIEARFQEADDPAALEAFYAGLYPLNRIGKLEDMVKAISFLADDDSSFITGEIMQVCGGSLI